jgi:hypothetical protein
MTEKMTGNKKGVFSDIKKIWEEKNPETGSDRCDRGKISWGIKHTCRFY